MYKTKKKKSLYETFTYLNSIENDHEKQPKNLKYAFFNAPFNF